MPTTIKQIAALAGVSPGTVDRALHGRPGVNAAVAKRVRDIAEQCGYRPNAFAKELANTAKAKDVLVLLNARGNAYYNEVLRGMDAAEREYADYGVTVRRTLLKGYDIKGQVNALAEAKKTLLPD